MKKRIEYCFNKGAKTYHLASTLQNKVAIELEKKLSTISGSKILEIGCGTGLFSEKLNTHFPHASFLLSDIAPGMLAVCKKNLPHSPRINFARMDGENIDSTSTFDLIASNMTIHWFADIKASIDKLITRLAPNGNLIFSMVGSNSLGEWREICDRFNLPVSTPAFPSHQELQKNFPTMKIQVHTYYIEYKSGFDFLHSLKKIGATATQEHYQPLASGKLRRVLRQLNTRMQVSYEVVYGHYLK